MIKLTELRLAMPPDADWDSLSKLFARLASLKTLIFLEPHESEVASQRHTIVPDDCRNWWLPCPT